MAEVVIPVGYGRARMVFHHISTGSQASFAIGYQAGASTPSEAADFYYGAMTAPLGLGAVASMASTWRFDGVETRQREAGGIVGGAHIQPVQGSQPGTPPPPLQVAALVQTQTQFLGRQFRGRFYLPPAYWTGADTTATGLSSSAAQSLNAYVSTFQSEVIAVGTPVISVLLHSPPLNGETPAPTPLTAFSAQTIFATQRRRLRR